MKRMCKIDAYISLKHLRNAVMADSHMSLHNLLDYAVENETLTFEEAKEFDKLFRKLITVEHDLNMDIYKENSI